MVKVISYPKAFSIAAMIHLIIFFALLISPSPKPQAVTVEKSADKPIIQAVSIDESMVMAQVHRRRQEELEKQVLKHKQQVEAKRQQQRLQAQINKARLERKKVQQHLQSIKQQIASQRHSVKQQQSELQKIKKQRARAKQSLQATQQKMAKQQQRIREQARLRAQRIAAEKRAKAEAALKEIKLSNNQGEINRYAVMIKQSIARHWILPGEKNKNLSCRYQVVLAPSGDVLEVKLLQSSGNPALDRAAKTAIYKSSPLPVPGDPDLFVKFKTFNITMRPEKIIATL